MTGALQECVPQVLQGLGCKLQGRLWSPCSCRVVHFCSRWACFSIFKKEQLMFLGQQHVYPVMAVSG
ncbi:unnamed protein product [Calypogeia fissa]